ncbi:MAG: aryl-sulfate sulfotransferase [Flavobacteriales bacterium]|nr:aryl-sulfate sulfotransferase [Flavobacteriales bacterium]
MFTIRFSLLGALLLCVGFSFGQEFDGYALFNSTGSNTAYLIDSEGDIAHYWSCDEEANYAIALTPTGNIVRGAVYQGNQINGAAVGGMVQELDADANVVWEFVYSSSTVVSHHDLCLMPNGHVLLIAWEYLSNADLAAMGYEGTQAKYGTHIIEVAQNGTGGEIVWEWHIKDHFVQDVDSNLDNYGVVSEHPELLNINVTISGSGGPGGGGGGASDWFHVNGLDYNPTLDQIVFSSRFMSEVFIIDHSTTTEEAASHTGGNSGKGGDFLYRWGHPDNYDMSGSQIIPAAVHDARWIPEGRPYAGYVQVFNNEGNNGHSTVDAINPPLNGYNYDWTPGQQYQPASYDLRHECLDDANGQSASDRMSNGNIFVNLAGGMGGGGYMYEVDGDDNVVFQYNANSAKGFRYECDHPGIQALLDNPCDTPDEVEDLSRLGVNLFPNPSTGVFHLAGEFPLSGVEVIKVFDATGKLILDASNTDSIDLSGCDDGIYVAYMECAGQAITRRISVRK